MCWCILAVMFVKSSLVRAGAVLVSVSGWSVWGWAQTQLLAPALSQPDLVTAPLQEQARANSRDRWVLGGTLSSMPSYTGGNGRSVGLRPVVAGQIGRWTVSSSSARGLADMAFAGGVSTTVAEAGRWQFGLGARLTNGRRSADDPFLAGMPDIRSSVGLRASARYARGDGWRLTGSVQQDLLRGQGLRGVLGVGWTQPVGHGWVLDASGGLNLGTARAMRTFYGVPTQAAQPGRPAWQPGGGVESWFWSVGLSKALSPHWRVAGSVGGGTLLGDAARSPLTQSRTGYIAQVSLAYVGW